MNKISWGDALALGYVQQFNDGAFHEFRLGLGLCGLSNTIHCTSLRNFIHHFWVNDQYPKRLPHRSNPVCSKMHTFANL
jgi:hypothetical protein